MFCTTAAVSRKSALDALNEAIKRLQAMGILSRELDEVHTPIKSLSINDDEVLQQTWRITNKNTLRLCSTFMKDKELYVCRVQKYIEFV